MFKSIRKPEGLPWRNVAECYLLYKGNIVAQIGRGGAGKYLSLPGGGIDRGETPEIGAKRELKEELGAVLKGRLQLVSVIKWDWNPEWANTEKRKARYMQYRGEKVYSFIGEIERFENATSDEGDAWTGRKTMSLENASKFMCDMYEKRSLPNQREYNAVKCSIISLLSAINKMGILSLSKVKVSRKKKKINAKRNKRTKRR